MMEWKRRNSGRHVGLVSRDGKVLKQEKARCTWRKRGKKWELSMQQYVESPSRFLIIGLFNELREAQQYAEAQYLLEK